ncbi:MAG: biotin--[acetyl-CoA-carboxylase] ligase [Alphaproteobacteria bacterium]|nr:biotin--[acetyl-CoA-carboxylase] ligase [Alphaproteobacteria bacterium]
MTDWRIFNFDTVESTNDTAKEYSRTATDNFVITADKQTAGRGRRGRRWVSLDGNLFCSIGLKFELKHLGKLVLLSSLSLLQAIKNLKPDADVKLKWPNDVLLNGAKVSGMLLEKGADDFMIVGIGVNIKQSPVGAQMLYKTTSLYTAGIHTDKENFLNLLLQKLSENLDLLQKDPDFVRFKWLEYAKGLNEEIVVCQDNVKKMGIFTGIDENAALLLNTEQGLIKILVGDVFYMSDEND